MRAYILTVIVTDFDQVESHGPGSIASTIEHARYPNRRISPDVKHTEAFDIGEWSDDHPLNLTGTDGLAWLRANGTPCALDAAAEERDILVAKLRLQSGERERRRSDAIASLTDDQIEALGLKP